MLLLFFIARVCLHVDTSPRAHGRALMHARTRALQNARTPTRTASHACAHALALARTRTFLHKHSHALARTRTHSHTHTHTHTLTHTHTHTQGFCFEFGAWDGIFASNCRYLYEQATPAYAHAHAHTHARAYARTHAHAHAQSRTPMARKEKVPGHEVEGVLYRICIILVKQLIK